MILSIGELTETIQIWKLDQVLLAAANSLVMTVDHNVRHAVVVVLEPNVFPTSLRILVIQVCK
jgi:hypothetical protein